MNTAATTEGIVLDPVYSGRDLAGLIAAVQDRDIRPGRRTVFLHTGGLHLCPGVRP
jgi:D-cysteine desulfhydrase